MIYKLFPVLCAQSSLLKCLPQNLYISNFTIEFNIVVIQHFEKNLIQILSNYWKSKKKCIFLIFWSRSILARVLFLIWFTSEIFFFIVGARYPKAVALFT